MCLTLAVVMMVTPAQSEELWDYHLRGVDEGLAAGALPPAGFYFINDFYFVPSFKRYGAFDGPTTIGGITANLGPFNASEAASNVKLNGYVDVPILVWSTGCKFLGADVGMAIAQPFDWTNTRVSNQASVNTLLQGTNAWDTGDQWGTYNTIVVPAILAWKWCDFRIKAAMQFGMNDGTTSPGDSLAGGPATFVGNDGRVHDNPFFHVQPTNGTGTGPLNTLTGPLAPFNGLGITGQTAYFPSSLVGRDGNVYAWSSNDNWQFTPNLGISWLHAGWNISADFFYTWYTKDSDTQYQNGPEFAADYTISYTCGKWTFGLGAEQQNQTSNDKFDSGDGTGYHSQANTKASNYTMGPLIGYNFGPCSLMFMYNFALETKNDVGGDWFNLRLVVPLGNPYPLGGR